MTAQAYEIARTDEGGWRIEDDFVRAFLFAGRERALLIDTGLGTGDLKAVCASLTDKPVTLIHTHADADHIGGDRAFDEILMHPAEYPYFFEQARVGGILSPGAKVRPVWEGDVWDSGGRRFEVILIPGHTPGSIALLDRENRVLIPGDSVSTSPVFLFGRTRNVAAYIESLNKLLALRDAFDVCYPSHGSFPLSPDILETLIEGARRLNAGELKGRAPEACVPALLYEYDGVSFYYADESHTP